ncbi:DUF4303 domain-containing protein [Nocardiopsis sp. NPDC050513]|uniref:DUF4303 domain-containing protein n=1 Tax=Nocardiopsis sp. NPDC050513 TaxID=3364338 RepID=UPI0037BDC3AD
MGSTRGDSAAVPHGEERLRAEVVRAALAAFTGLRDARPDADLCGYALYSDADAMTVCCAANTRRHLDRLTAEDPADADYYEWTPAEWAVEGVAAEEFASICRCLRDARESVGEAESTRFRDTVYEACVAALESLVADGAFGPGADHVVVFAVSDPDDDDPERETGWIRRLNPPERADRFARWRAASAEQ